MTRVRNTTVVDDDNILFHLRGGDIHLNMLDETCLGLRRSGVFTYTVQSGARHARLCHTDTITVLDTTGRGFSCGLGRFHPVTETQAQDLLNPDEATRLERTIVVEPVELPESDQTPESDGAEPGAQTAERGGNAPSAAAPVSTPE